MHIFRTSAKQINVEKNAEHMLTLIWKTQRGKAASRVFYKKGFLRNFEKFLEKIPVFEDLF